MDPSSGPPRPRPPPPMAAGNEIIRGVGQVQRPPGPPPRGVPTNSTIKPPPLAPPPQSLVQTQQRPAPEAIRQIVLTPKVAVPISPSNLPTNHVPPPFAPRGPPPRIPPPPSRMIDSPIDYEANIVAASIAPSPKFADGKSGPFAKAGAIPMFEDSPEPPQEPADKKLKSGNKGLATSNRSSDLDESIMVSPTHSPTSRSKSGGADNIPRKSIGFKRPPPRLDTVKESDSAQEGASSPPRLAGALSSRPAPPAVRPPGIPDAQPLPPKDTPPSDRKAPPPLRPPPSNRAPPKEDPEEPASVPRPAPPTTEPPFVKGLKKPPLPEEYVKRRDREDPEFESSSSEEDEETGARVPKDRKGHRGNAPGVTAGVTFSPPATVTEEPVSADTLSIFPVDEVYEKKTQLGAIDSKQLMKSPLPPGTVDDFKQMNEFVAPVMDRFYTPAVAGDVDVDSQLARTLRAGRLTIRCVEGLDVRRKDDANRVPRIDPCIRFRLGVGERHPWKSTSIKRKQTNYPNFEKEIVRFDILDPAAFVFKEDMELCIELWNKSTIYDECIGVVSVSVVRFLTNPYITYEERVPLNYPKSAITNGKLKLEFLFEEARNGMLALTLKQAKGLRILDPLEQQNPLVSLSLGDLRKRSRVIKNGGANPYFGEETLLVFVDQFNWVNSLGIAVIDEHGGYDRPLGLVDIDFLPYMNAHSSTAKDESFPLHYFVTKRKGEPKEEVSAGDITMKIQFVVAGKLEVFVDNARGVKLPDEFASTATVRAAGGRIDAYVQFRLDGLALTTIKKTPVDKDGGSDPQWKHKLTFDIVDQYMLDVEMYHQDLLGTDVQIGFATVSLLNVFRAGKYTTWTTFKQKMATGRVTEVGDLLMEFNFSGPAGVAFPQFRPDVDSFDDSWRNRGRGVSFATDVVSSPPSSPLMIGDGTADRHGFSIQDSSMIPSNDGQPPPRPQSRAMTADGSGKGASKTGPQSSTDLSLLPHAPSSGQPAQSPGHHSSSKSPPRPPADSEFTEAEISAAFRFIDLDRNNFVGAREIRHILVCMGELITDEEIDCMIGLVDADGDGQVSYTEFRAMVLHPDPGAVDMHKEVLMQKSIADRIVENEKSGKTGRPVTADLSIFQRQKEMQTRESKKKMMSTFVDENEVSFDRIKHAFDYYASLPRERRHKGRVIFDDFCQAFVIEAINEYRILFSLFDPEETQTVDLREFLLSIMNFIEVDKEERIRFSFVMFDDRKIGYITKTEIEEILRGNHMISLASVQRKAETVMKQASSASGTGLVTMNELVVIFKKFPNIMLPSIGITK